jgi:hypothetical protein
MLSQYGRDRSSIRYDHHDASIEGTSDLKKPFLQVAIFIINNTGCHTLSQSRSVGYEKHRREQTGFL